MNKFIGILLIMGVVHIPEIRLYWSNDPMYMNTLIKSIMPRDRFLAILRFWHFCDNNQARCEDRLHKISSILHKINENFQKHVKPGKEVVIDESMVPWRGRLLFRQYIPGKRHKYGIKLYKLCLPEGYTYNMSVYSGKREYSSEKGHAHDIVMKLMNGLLYEGRILYTDSFYTSVPLAKELLEKNTYLCGTVRSNRKHLPQAAKIKQKNGEILGLQNSGGIKFVKWTDKRPVLMLTTCKTHKCTLVDVSESVRKPDTVISYNAAKKGVDISDQMSSYYTSLRKTIKWYRKIIIELICGTMLINAWCIHKKLDNQKKLSILQFRENIITALLAQPTIAATPTASKKKEHFLKKYERATRVIQKRCKECYNSISKKDGREAAMKKTKKVVTYCPDCKNQPALCLECFKKIHN
ncbi:piggyBac transposable element-derived protein 4-like [Ischnura elegans]|uniref:piggyBac transposable element-derived protein 4-like n=1 Tax=Ischnura elegans TaxID=197161 RepID=UPI001ED87699|nr:piggyBac transposable element-derived protein 4-like [Ischnura elegans]